MRDIVIKVFGFDELSQEAQTKAHEIWVENSSQHDYGWSSENEAVLDAIAAATGVKVSDWMYNTCDYRYSIDNIEQITHPDGYYANDGNMDELVGLRAAKVALALYYQLTEQRIVYGFEKDTNETVKSTLNYCSRLVKMRHSKFMKVDECFTGYCFSEVFTSALWASIAENGNCGFYSVRDHLQAAFNKLFQGFTEDMAYQETTEYFTDGPAYEVEYFKDGGVCYYREMAA